MLINFIAQPQQQLGSLLTVAIGAPNTPTKVTLVSAFASLTAVLRLKKRLHELKAAGTLVWTYPVSTDTFGFLDFRSA